MIQPFLIDCLLSILDKTGAVIAMMRIINSFLLATKKQVGS